MKKAFSLLAALALLHAAGCTTGKNSAEPQNRLEKILDTGKIILATSPDYAPQEFIDHTKSGQQQYAGAEIEMARYIAQQLEVELVIEAMDFAAVQAAVSTGAVDMAISGFAWKEDRAAGMELSTFYNCAAAGSQGILVPAELAGEYKTAGDFAEKTLAAQNGSLQWELAQSQLPGDIMLEPVASLSDAVMLLLSGKVDAVVCSLGSGELLAKSSPGLQMSEFLFDYEREGNVLAVPKGEAELIDAINKIIGQINADGLYEQWNDSATRLAHELGLG